MIELRFSQFPFTQSDILTAFFLLIIRAWYCFENFKSAIKCIDGSCFIACLAEFHSFSKGSFG